MRPLRKLLAHPRTQTTRKIVRRTLAVTSVILAVVFILTLTRDIGDRFGLRELAERQGTQYLNGRTMRIGSLSIRVWDGAYVVRDLTIDGLTAKSPPWLVAKEIIVRMPDRRSLWSRQVVIDSIEMSDWKMYVEQTPDGHSFPKFGKGPSDGPRRWTTTLKYVRSHRGEFTYDDKTTPWSVVARNIDVTVAKPAGEYRGSARFSNGLVAIQDYLPFRADMDTTFKINGGRVLFDQINLATDGTKSVLKGDVDMSHWPEQMYSVKSKIDLPRMRQIWFAKDKFELTGIAEFDGYFHLFKGEVRPDGKTSGGREVKGTFRTSGMHVNDYRFDDVAGSVLWNPRLLRVHDASARLYGGAADFEYSMAPLGVRDVKPTNTFDANYRNVDLTELSDFFDLMGIRLAGRGSGHNLMKWPSGRFRERTWTGTVTADPPAGTTLMTRNMPLDELKQRAPRNQKPGEFSPHLPKGPVPIGGTITYSLGPEFIEIGPSQIATPTTYVEIEGRTAYGERSQMPFHVTSSDWQDSDRLFAGMLTAFGSKTKVIPVDGYGTFDGTMFNEFRRPRIEGKFAGEGIRAFDVTWGSVTGDAVIENSYADVKNVMVSAPDGSTMTVDGKFSLGYPRRDGGEQVNATIRIDGRPVADLKHAFDIDDYDFSGRMSGNFKVTGEYQRPVGSGTMTITEGKAYGETFDTATADVKLEGDNVRLDNIQAKKGDGQGSGAASITWKGTYSFNFEGSNLAAEKLSLTQGSTIPFSGVIAFKADGSGSFDRPQYKVHATINDLFVADEGIGNVSSDFIVDGDLLTFTNINASSARLSVFGAGTLALTDTHDVDIRFNVLDTSLDPYIRAFEPRLSPYTTARVGGSLHVYGELSDIDNVLIDADVDQFDARLFDFQIRNPDDPKAAGRRIPIRLELRRHSVRVVDMRLEGQDTNLNVAGNVDLHNEMIAMRLDGGANLRILQGFTRNVSSRGTAKVDAELSGNMRSPLLSGKMEVNDARIRHYSLPALEKIAGVVTFDSKGINLDELTAQIGGGPVTFGGSIGIEGYRPGRVDVTIVGENMTLRYPESLSPWLVATVDADLTLDGSVDALNLGGEVDVHRAQYTKRLDTGVNFFDFGQSSQTAVGSAFLTPTLPLSYNVHINAPSTITANNNLLQNVAASADVTLVGTFDRPGLTGNIDVDRGDVYFGGRRYQIRTGSTIRFDNLSAIEPFFDIEAVTRIRVPGETYVVTVTNAGPNFSNVVFSSDPSLPELQLLALLLSDVAPSKDVEFRQYQGITPQEQMLRDQVTRILTSSATGEFNRAVQDALAVESFQFSPTLIDPNVQSARLDPGARVTFVKRVGNRVYLTYSRSLSSTTRDQVIVLEIDQTDRLSWILSRNEDGTYALDFRVRRTCC